MRSGAWPPQACSCCRRGCAVQPPVSRAAAGQAPYGLTARLPGSTPAGRATGWASSGLWGLALACRHPTCCSSGNREGDAAGLPAWQHAQHAHARIDRNRCRRGRAAVPCRGNSAFRGSGVCAQQTAGAADLQGTMAMPRFFQLCAALKAATAALRSSYLRMSRLSGAAQPPALAGPTKWAPVCICQMHSCMSTFQEAEAAHIASRCMHATVRRAPHAHS